MKHIYAVAILVFSWTASFGQVVTIDPPFPSVSDDITVTFDATLGNGNLAGVVPVYAHTGVILEGEEGWQNVQGNWGTADENVLMTPLGNSLHEITFNIEEYYGLEPGDVVEQLAFVFRNASGTIEGKNADGSDIFVDIYGGGFVTTITAPFEPLIFTDNPTDEIAFSAIANQSSELILYLDNDQIASDLGVDELSTTVDFSASPEGQYWLWAEAFNGMETVYDSVYVIIQGGVTTEPSPPGVVDGINYIDDETVILQLYAPFKDFVYVLGDFNDWEFSTDYFMNQTPDGERYWIEISGLNPGQEYRFQYSIDEEDMRVADIYADKILDPFNDDFIPETVYPNLIEYPDGETTEIVSVLQTDQEPYNWVVEDFDRPPSDNLIIYELLIRDFDESHTYQAVINRLDYLEDLGINAIELMPFTEFEGNESWGYNPMFYFAPDKYYGTKADLKQLVDECHQRGIAVIQDVVLNHSFGQNPQLRMYSQSGGPAGPPADNSPFFNVEATHPFNVGYDYNHDAPIVQEFVKRNLQYWVEEYKIDGFRFDLSKGFTQNFSSDVGQWNQYDQDRINHWNRIRDEVYEYDDEVYLILEHLGDNPEETELANNGFLLWGNINHEYSEASMGYNSNLNWANYQSRGWDNPNLVSYAESHDEERLMYKNLEFGNSSDGYDVTNLSTALSRQEAIMAFNSLLRGPKMIWQFKELGYDYSIDYCPDGTINPDCRTANKPVRWDYLDEPDRFRLYEITSAINKLKTDYEAFRSNDYQFDVNGFGKRLIIEHETMDVVVIANFDVEPISLIPGFTQTGTWYDYFAGESIVEENLNNAFELQPGEYRIYTTVELEDPDISVDVEEVAFDGGSILKTFPNPFSDYTQISYSLTKGQQVAVDIYDAQGRLVSRLYDGNQTPGEYQLRWNGKNDRGMAVPSGVYLVTLTGTDGVATTKILYQNQ
ncbi:MAG: alpha-amylase family glycosyl hydrolase [Cryomorphaceae bacterium]|nr:T9SS type A sorting domain-containing protein [Flavobacteriales bacterium]